MAAKRKAAAAPATTNRRLHEARMARGLSQRDLADGAGLTRQAVYAIEGGHYLPNVAVALRIAELVGRSVEELFGTAERPAAFLEGELVGGAGRGTLNRRAKVWSVGERTLVLPIARLGAEMQLATAADGLIVGPLRGRVRVELLTDPAAVRAQVVVAGCDPAIHLVGERMRGQRHRDAAAVLGWPMGSTAAVLALRRGEVHAAGVHVVDPLSGESNVGFVAKHLKGVEVALVTFAAWQAGFLVKRGNPLKIRDAGDLRRKDVRLVNREAGAGARLLLDQRLAAAAVRPASVRGYRDLAFSHHEVGRRIADGSADIGVGVESVARLHGLTFLPLQTERYDLVIPAAQADNPGIVRLLEVLASRPARADIEALGGYSTRDSGRRVELPGKPIGHLSVLKRQRVK